MYIQDSRPVETCVRATPLKSPRRTWHGSCVQAGSSVGKSELTSIDLSTTYLGLHLANPFMAGASPLADHLDTVRRLEDAGCAGIVLHSLFEEQISQAESG